MMTIALNKRLVIINGENSTGSGILINNQGLILSCYHNFYNQETDEERIVKQISIHSTGAWFDIQYSKNIEFCFNEKKYDELKFDDAFLLRLKLDKDSSQLKDIDKLLISRDVNENDEVTIIAWDNVYDRSLIEHSGKVLSIEPATKDHPNRFHVKVDGYPGYSGGGVFKNGQLIGIINYIQTQRQNNIIASFIPNYIVSFINEEILIPIPLAPPPLPPNKPPKPSEPQPFITFRQGAISTSTVAFISIKGLKEIGGIDSVELLAKLHSSIKSIIDKNNDYKGIDVLSSLLGAIILFSDSLQLDPLKLIISINNEMHSCGIPIRIGMSHGDIQELVDIDGKANFIGVAINHSARLATSNKNPGLLVHDVLANHLQSKLRSSHWLSARNSSRLFIEIEGKRDEKFNCYYPPESIWPIKSTITYQYDEQFQPISKNAAIISYDLPNFSDGDLNQLSQRFRAITDVFLALAAQTKLPLEYFYFSPGGDGGVMVFADLNKKTVYDLANNFAERLAIESQNRSSLISVQCRIGLHYGTILLYENAVESLRPTGDDIFIADSITSDEEAKKAGKLIFTEPFKSAVSGGDNRYFEANFSSLSALRICSRDINRYSSSITTHHTKDQNINKVFLIKFEAHQARFRASPILYYFLSITNLSTYPVTITHLWYEDTNNHIPINPESRPLPKTLQPSEVWASWLPVASIPRSFTNNAYDMFKLRLSDSQVISSCKNLTIPPVGSVPGGNILDSDIKQPTVSQPLINPQQEKSTAFTSSDSSLRSILENHKKVLMDKIAAAYKQLGFPISEADKVAVQNQIDSLQQDLEKINSKLLSM